jgi:flavin-dependent thymidylate synthase
MKTMQRIEVLDKGHVDLVDHMGSDLTVANSARVSFDTSSHFEIDHGGMPVLSDKDAKLIKYLAKHNHWTPFGHPQMTLRIKAPISIRTQFFKHKVGFCISGDAEVPFLKITKNSINVRRNTIEKIYNDWNYINPKGIHTKREFIKKRKTRVFNTNTEEFDTGYITNIVCNGNKEVFEITTSNEKKLKLTEDHRILTKDGFVPLKTAVGLFHNGTNWDMQKDCYVLTIPKNNTKLKTFSRISNIRHAGVEMVYDINIDHPEHNFVANEIVIHNCENEISRRYVTLEPEFYDPTWRTKPEGGAKQGSEDFMVREGAAISNIVYRRAINQCLKSYNYLLKRGVAPEQARFVLPQGMYTEWYWTGSLAAYARFYKQRTDPHAQWEIQEYSKAIGKIIEPLFPVSWKHLTSI